MILTKTDYLDKMKKLLNEKRKFEKTNITKDRISSFPANEEKQLEHF